MQGIGLRPKVHVCAARGAASANGVAGGASAAVSGPGPVLADVPSWKVKEAPASARAALGQVLARMCARQRVADRQDPARSSTNLRAGREATEPPVFGRAPELRRPDL